MGIMASASTNGECWSAARGRGEAVLMMDTVLFLRGHEVVRELGSCLAATVAAWQRLASRNIKYEILRIPALPLCSMFNVQCVKCSFCGECSLKFFVVLENQCAMWRSSRRSYLMILDGGPLYVCRSSFRRSLVLRSR